MRENNTDEAKKADVSQNDVESPATEDQILDAAMDTVEVEPEESNGEEVEVESTEDTDTEAAPEEETEAPRKEGRKTAESRIRELVTEKKAAEQRAESLADQVKKATSYKPEQNYQPQQSDETELTYEELMRRNDALINIRLAQQENIHRVQQESLEATNAYPELNPESDAFDSELSESISQATMAKIQADPTSNVRGFVDQLMRPYKRSLEKQASGQKEAITKQVSQQAVRPTQVQEQEKPFSELSIEEMEKKLERVYH